MKLVDILARELKVWPKNVQCIVQDADVDATIYGVLEGNLPEFHVKRWTGAEFHCVIDRPSCLSSDHCTSMVTRAQWQAAVDAPNKPLVEPAWNGEDLPPAGTACEYKRSDGWRKVEVFAVKPNCNDSYSALFTFDDGVWGACAHPSLFRPIRTAEQIAADERLHKVRNALTAIKASRHFPGDEARQNVMVATVEAMIDAGFVQQVAQ